MLMSQEAMSPCVATCPRSGLWAARHGAARIRKRAAATEDNLSIHMFHLARLAHAPSGDGIAVVKRFVASLGNHLFARGLVIAFLSGSTALQRGRSAIPLPSHAEARYSNGEHGFLQRGQRPALAAVGRDFDLGDPTLAGPREPRNFMETGDLHREPRRWPGDH